MQQRAAGDRRAAKDGDRLPNNPATFSAKQNSIRQFVIVDVELHLHPDEPRRSVNGASRCAALKMEIVTKKNPLTTLF